VTAPSDVSELPWYNDQDLIVGTESEGISAVDQNFGNPTTDFLIQRNGSITQYFYSGGSGNPNFLTNGLKAGDLITIDASSFNVANRGTFVVLTEGLTEDSFRVYNPSGVDELIPAMGSYGIRKVASPIYKLLQNLIEWNTVQKDEVEFSIPITAANILLELTDRIAFSDAIYTNSSSRGGWIELIEIDTQRDQINVRAVLDSSSEIIDTEIQDVPVSYESSGYADWEDQAVSQEPTYADIQDTP
jgi:hypothetical protein